MQPIHGTMPIHLEERQALKCQEQSTHRDNITIDRSCENNIKKDATYIQVFLPAMLNGEYIRSLLE